MLVRVACYSFTFTRWFWRVSIVDLSVPQELSVSRGGSPGWSPRERLAQIKQEAEILKAENAELRTRPLATDHTAALEQERGELKQVCVRLGSLSYYIFCYYIITLLYDYLIISIIF